MPTIQTDLRRTVYALADALDLVGVDDRHHGKRVGIMAFACARALGWPREEQEFVFDLGLLHDCGVSSTRVHHHLVAEFAWKNAEDHCVRGASLLAASPLFAPFAPFIRHHHTPWPHLIELGIDERTARLANLIFLVDRVDALTAPHYGDPALLYYRNEVLDRITALQPEFFSAELVDALRLEAAKEAFWLALEPPHLDAYLEYMATHGEPRLIGLPELRDLGRLFAAIVDAKSTFTLQHSAGVAALSARLAERAGLPPERRDAIEVAGLLHDLGKLRVPDEILDKPGKLDEKERAVIERHSFETFTILRRIPGLEAITEWASLHHETLAGDGYPFRRRGEELSLEARIVAVADVYQALVQDRPYRASLPDEVLRKILADFVAQKHLDGDLVALLLAEPDARALARGYEPERFGV